MSEKIQETIHFLNNLKNINKISYIMYEMWIVDLRNLYIYFNMYIVTM